MTVRVLGARVSRPSPSVSPDGRQFIRGGGCAAALPWGAGMTYGFTGSADVPSAPVVSRLVAFARAATAPVAPQGGLQ